MRVFLFINIVFLTFSSTIAQQLDVGLDLDSGWETVIDELTKNCGERYNDCLDTISVLEIETPGTIKNLNGLTLFKNLRRIKIKNQNIKSLSGLEGFDFRGIKLDLENNIFDFDAGEFWSRKTLATETGAKIGTGSGVGEFMVNKIYFWYHSQTKLDKLILNKHATLNENETEIVSSFDKLEKLFEPSKLILKKAHYDIEYKKGDFRFLNNLTGIKALIIKEFNIPEIDFFYRKNNIKLLSCRENNVKKISTLDKCPKLEVLDISLNEIENIDILKNCLSLKTLIAGFNKIETIESLEQLKDLQVIWLRKNNLTDISPLGNKKYLVNLNLNDNNRLKNLKPLGTLSNLKEVYLDYCDIDDLRPLLECKKIEVLSFKGNRVQYLQEFEGFNKLIIFDCSNNEISDLSAIKSLTRLKKLECNNNHIKDLAFIKEFVNPNSLEYFACEQNAISSITPVFKYLKNLRVLRVSHNKIQSLKGISNLKKLYSFSCVSNEGKVTIKGCDELGELSELRNLYFFNNISIEEEFILLLNKLFQWKIEGRLKGYCIW